MIPRDILLDPDEEKEKAYEQIHALYRQGKPVTVREHESGFPAVTVDLRTFISSPVGDKGSIARHSGILSISVC